MYTEYEQFVDNLAVPQLRAFANQCGILAWAKTDVKVLQAIMRANEHGLLIWENVYGKEASISQ